MTATPDNAQQHSQATGVDAINLRQIEYQCADVRLGKHRVPQDRIFNADDDSALTSKNGNVSQVLNGYSQHLRFPWLIHIS